MPEIARKQRRNFLRVCGASIGATVFIDFPVWAQSAARSSDSRRPSHLVRFGKTDLYVSRLCQGTAFRKNKREADDPNAQKVLRRCLEIGVNFFDSSNAYGWGGSELALGKAIAGHRHDLVICTKVHPGLKPEGTAPSRKVAFTLDFASRQLEGSLKRLGTDYLDLYLLHNPDGVTGAVQVAETMDTLVKTGKVRYWGVSNHTPAQVSEFVEIGKRNSKSAIAGIQNYYNIVHRELESEMFPLLRRTGLGLMPYSPLDEGRLLQDSTAEQDLPRGTLFTALDTVARQIGATRAQVLIAWVLSHPEATCALAGAEQPEHVEDNFKGTQLVLPPEAIKTLNTASDAYTYRVKENKKTP